MEPRFTTRGILKRAATNKRIVSEATDNRDEMIHALQQARNAMVGLTGCKAYDERTGSSRAPENHWRLDFTKEIEAIENALHHVGVE